MVVAYSLGMFGFESFLRLDRCQRGPATSEGLPAAGDLLPAWLPPKAGKLLLAPGKSPGFFSTWASPWASEGPS